MTIRLRTVFVVLISFVFMFATGCAKKDQVKYSGFMDNYPVFQPGPEDGIKHVIQDTGGKVVVMELQTVKEGNVGVQPLGQFPCEIPFHLFLFGKICGHKDFLECGFSGSLLGQQDGNCGVSQNLVGDASYKEFFYG